MSADIAIAFLGISDWPFVAPIFVGDTLFVEYELVELRDSRSRPRQAIANFDVQVLNQHAETLQRGTKTLLVSKTPLEAVAAGVRS